MLAVDALRYSMNIPSVQMQYLVGSQTTAEFAESLGIASAEYIMGQDPGLSLALGSVPVNLTNMTQAYSTFAQQGELQPGHDHHRDPRPQQPRHLHPRRTTGRPVTNPMTPAEAYLPHFILEGNTDPGTQPPVGHARAARTPPTASGGRPASRPAPPTTSATSRASGTCPGSLTTGVWMGNNNQEQMSNVLGEGLFSADGPLFLWQEFMTRALNEPWDWNGRSAGRADELRAAGGHRAGRRLPLQRDGRHEQLRPDHHAAVPRGNRAAARQRPHHAAASTWSSTSPSRRRIGRTTGSSPPTRGPTAS